MTVSKFWIILTSTLLLSIIFFGVSFLRLKQVSRVQIQKAPETAQAPAPTVKKTSEIRKTQQATVSSALAPSVTQPGVLGLSKKSYNIAIFGDSMVDTMGESLEYLAKNLHEKYPNTEFSFYNYGIGAQNVEMGLNRFHKKFEYKTRKFPPLSVLKPDVLVIASFAYNPFSPHDRDKHWITLSKLLDEAAAVSPKVYILAEIAPLEEGFGKGPNGINWPENLAYEHATHIVEQINNAIGLSKAKNLPLINAYNPSRKSGKFGLKIYVNEDDGIHPSVSGHQFMANLIASNIKLD